MANKMAIFQDMSFAIMSPSLCLVVHLHPFRKKQRKEEEHWGQMRSEPKKTEFLLHTFYQILNLTFEGGLERGV